MTRIKQEKIVSHLIVEHKNQPRTFRGSSDSCSGLFDIRVIGVIRGFTSPICFLSLRTRFRRWSFPGFTRRS